MAVRRLTLIAFFTALIAILAQLAVPLPFSPVPVTGQLIGVFLAATLLGGRDGCLAIFAYLLLGAAGAPVFSLGRGGLMMLLGPTGGYLWGFLPGVYLSGRIQAGNQRPGAPGLLTTAGATLFTLGCIYLCGTIQLSLVTGYSTGEAILAGVLPFIPLDVAKAFIAAALGARVKKSMHAGGLLHSDAANSPEAVRD
jgi:biotin transport system substrate-specific component